jgi:predicted ATP-grasp superfamily ATP-dependent carboligase
MKKILIIDGNSRNALAIVRSLGKAGYICDITAYTVKRPSQKMMLFFRSKYIRNIHFIEPYDSDEEHMEAAISILKKEAYNFIIPAGTWATNFLSRYKEEFQVYATPLVEDYEKLWLVHNKTQCMRLAQSLGIPTPRTFIIRSRDDLQKAAAEISFPVVVKYPDSCGSEGLWLTKARGREFEKLYIQKVPGIVNGDNDREYPIIQEQIHGPLMDTTAFAVDGECYGILTQERLVTAWLDGGGGLVNVTNNIPVIKEYARRIIENLRWTGPVEMDWIYDAQSGEYKLLEINPKFWGTTQLTISAGYDFPLWLVKMAEGEQLEEKENYVTGLMFRWIFNELQAILEESKNYAQFKKEFIGFLRRFRYHPCMYDIFLEDLKPSLLDLFSFLRNTIFSPRFWKSFGQMLIAK